MSTDKKLEEWWQVYAKSAEWEWSEAMSYCESPIEQLFLAEVLLSGWSEDRSLFDRMGCHVYSRKNSFDVLVQATLYDKYRVDFVAIASNGVRVAIELDGHDFHERTKEQAARDKSRDRDLARHGWIVMRFTGSEIFHDVAKCWAEVESTVMDRWHAVSEAKGPMS